MDKIVTKTIEKLNELLPVKKKLINEDSTPLISKNSNLDSIDLVNLFTNLEQIIQKEKKLNLTFDDLIENINQLETIGSLKYFLTQKFKNEKK
jgi:acyl carrier protein